MKLLLGALFILVLTTNKSWADVPYVHCALRVNSPGLQPVSMDLDPSMIGTNDHGYSQTLFTYLATTTAPQQHTFILQAEYWRDDLNADPNLFMMNLFEIDGGKTPVVLGNYQTDFSQPLSKIMSVASPSGVTLIANCVSHN